ncbi:MAG: sporulation protein [Clostridia bacterium]|nr:sporulation protein [Clostridia bacterium]
MQRFLKILFSGFVLYLVSFLVVSPEPCLAAAKEALSLCAQTVIPVLFPFFVCSGLLSALGFSSLCSHFLSPIMRPLFNLPGSGAITFFMGILSGYPVGAATAASLYSSGHCTKTEAERMLAFCNNSGSLFVIGVVGCSYLESPILGRYLYISHIIAAVLTGIFFRFYKGSPENNHTLPPSADTNKKAALFSLGSIIDSSVFSILKVCGFVIFFAVFTSTLPRNPFLYPLVEIVGGLKVLAELESRLTLPLISFFLALSGVSVMFQVSAITAPHGLSLKPYILGKLCQGLISSGLTYLFLKAFPVTTETFHTDTFVTEIFTSPFGAALSSLVSIILAVAVLLFLSVMVSFLRRKPRL